MSDYSAKNVVVTGGAGFIGVNLAQKLIELGAAVTIIDHASSSPIMPLKNGRLIHADILNLEDCGEALTEADFVFHLAARTDLNGKTLDDYAVNTEGTRRLIAALKNNRKIQRFVLYSTQLVVGLFNETRFIDETEPYRTRTVYGESKIQAEKITIEECQKLDIPYTIIRPTSVYGPFGKSPYREYFQTIYRKRYFHAGKADNLVSMVYVKNLVDQTVFLAGNERARNQIFFGNDLHPYTMRELSDAVAGYFGYKISTIPDWIVWPGAYGLGLLKLFGIPVPLYPFRLRNIQANYCYDMGKTLRLGFLPNYELDQGIKETLDWYVKNDPNFH